MASVSAASDGTSRITLSSEQRWETLSLKGIGGYWGGVFCIKSIGTFQNIKQEEDAPKRVLWHKPMGWLSAIRPHRRDEAWSLADLFCQLCRCTDTRSGTAIALGLWLQKNRS
jgi:hypothetical protein